jgi:hypothetical protein
VIQNSDPTRCCQCCLQRVVEEDVLTSQSHFSLSFPLKSSANTKALAEQLASLMPELFQAEDCIDAMHYSCFTILSEKTLLFLGDFDGEFSHLMAELAHQAGPVFDAIFQHVERPPCIPVADNPDAFVEWTASHLLGAATLFSAYPEVTATEIRTRASAATGEGNLNSLLVVLPIQSSFAFMEVQLFLRAREFKTQQELEKIGTSHFAQFVPLENDQIGFFTVYDGPLDQFIVDFAQCMGPVLDRIFRFTEGAPPSPCRKHLLELIDFAAGASRAPIGFYQAYPGLTVEEIHTLIADSGSQSGVSRFEDFAA